MGEITVRRYAKPEGNRLTLSMTVHNEAGNLLEKVLKEHVRYIDDAVIIDDASTDSSGMIVHEALAGIPHRVIHNPVSKFSNEVELRKQQWDEAVRTNPDWILSVDADHIFEDRFSDCIRQLINQTEYDVINFRLYDFWDSDHYREDRYWNAHRTYRAFLVRYQHEFPYVWKDTPQHCGHFPSNIYQLPCVNSQLRLKHFGWADPQRRMERYKRYLKLDPEFKWGWKEQIESVIDKNPNLVEWKEV